MPKIYPPHGYSPVDEPTVVTLVGSTRFKDVFAEAMLKETLEGHIVLTIGCDMRTDQEIFGNLAEEERERVKNDLDVLHLHKIDISDEILVLNVGGYVGESTTREIWHAIQMGKSIRWWEPGSAVAILTRIGADIQRT